MMPQNRARTKPCGTSENNPSTHSDAWGNKKGRGTTPRPSTSFSRCLASGLAYLTHGRRHRTRASVEVIEAAVVARLEVHWFDYSASERAVRFAGRIENPDPAAAIVRVEVLALVRSEGTGGRRGVVEGTTGDRAARGRGGGVDAGMRVGEQGVLVVLKAGRRGGEALIIGPPVVRSPCYPIDFFPAVLADLVDEHRARARLDVEADRLAQPERPDAVFARGRTVEGVVGGDGAVAVDAQDLAVRVVQRLRVAVQFGVAGGVVSVADADVELAVCAEAQRSSVVGPFIGVGKGGQVD